MSETTELHGGILVTSFGQQVLFVDKGRYVAIMKKLVDDGFRSGRQSVVDDQAGSFAGACSGGRV